MHISLNNISISKFNNNDEKNDEEKKSKESRYKNYDPSWSRDAICFDITEWYVCV
jgi:hypothetical protein